MSLLHHPGNLIGRFRRSWGIKPEFKRLIGQGLVLLDGEHICSTVIHYQLGDELLGEQGIACDHPPPQHQSQQKVLHYSEFIGLVGYANLQQHQS